MRHGPFLARLLFANKKAWDWLRSTNQLHGVDVVDRFLAETPPQDQRRFDAPDADIIVLLHAGYQWMQVLIRIQATGD